MKSKNLFGIAVLAAMGILLASCPTGGGGGGGDDGGNGGGGGGGGPTATLIIKNTASYSITVKIGNSGAPGSKILSGLETKEIAAGAEATWTLGLDTDNPCFWSVTITPTGSATILYSWDAHDAKHGETIKLKYVVEPDERWDYRLVEQ